MKNVDDVYEVYVLILTAAWRFYMLLETLLDIGNLQRKYIYSERLVIFKYVFFSMWRLLACTSDYLLFHLRSVKTYKFNE